MTFERWADSLVPHSTGVAQQMVGTLPPGVVKRTILATPEVPEDTGREDPECAQGEGKSRKRRIRKKKAPPKESAWTQAEEEGTELQWQLEEKYQQKMEVWKSALLHLHQEDLREMEEDLASRHTSQIEELQWNHRKEIETLEKEKQVSQKRHELREAEMSELQEQQAVRMVGLEKSIKEQQNRAQQLETLIEQLGEQSRRDLAILESSFKATLKDKEREMEQLSGRMGLLQAKLEETTQQQRADRMASEEEIKRLMREKEQVQLELATEKASKAALEVQLRKVSTQFLVEVSGPPEEVTKAPEIVEEKEGELEDLQQGNVARSKERREIKRVVSKPGEESLGRGRELTQSERKTGFVRSWKQEMSSMHQQLEETEAEGKDLRQLVLAESVKNKGLEERLRLLQPKGSTAVSRAAERRLAMKTEGKNCHELTHVEYKKGLPHSCVDCPSEQGESDSSASEEAAVPLLLGGVCHRGRPPEGLDLWFPPTRTRVEKGCEA